MLYIILAVLMFGMLIILHEFGHFITAKLCGIQVNEFSIGMGFPLLQHQWGETLYSLRLLPFGGYCAMEENLEEGATKSPRDFGAAPAWKRLLVLVAGAAFNFLTGLLILLFLYSGMQYYSTATITGFMDGFPCQGESMLMEGDTIVKINGKRVLLSSDISLILQMDNGETADLVVRRDGQRVTLKDLPLTLREYETDSGKELRYGLYLGVEKATLGVRVKNGVYSACNFLRQTWWSLEMLLTGRAGMKDLSGPIGIVNTMSAVGTASPTVWDAVLNLLYFAAFISINLSVMNLLPLPALDGGRILFVLVNAVLALVLRREIPARYEQYVHGAGLLLLLALMVFVAVQDVVKLIF